MDGGAGRPARARESFSGDKRARERNVVLKDHPAETSAALHIRNRQISSCPTLHAQDFVMKEPEDHNPGPPKGYRGGRERLCPWCFFTEYCS